jgi:hypothetical protein
MTFTVDTFRSIVSDQSKGDNSTARIQSVKDNGYFPWIVLLGVSQQDSDKNC